MRTKRVLRLAALGLALWAAAGCGSAGGGGGGGDSNVTVAPGLLDGMVTNPGEVSVTDLQMFASAEYGGDGAVRAYAVVKDQDGTQLTDLNQRNFSVTLNPGHAASSIDPLEFQGFGRQTSDNRVTAVVIDVSGSMLGFKLRAAQTAAKAYVAALGATERAAVVSFNDKAQIVQPLTSDKDLLNAAIDSLVSDGVSGTNIGGGMSAAVRAVGAVPGRRGAVLLSDGDDTVDTGFATQGPISWYGQWKSTRYQALRLAALAELPFYTVGLAIKQYVDANAVDKEFTVAYQDLNWIAYFTDPNRTSFTPPQVLLDPKAVDPDTGALLYLPAANYASSVDGSDLGATFVDFLGRIGALTPLETYVWSFNNNPRPLANANGPPWQLQRDANSAVLRIDEPNFHRIRLDLAARIGALYRNGTGLLRGKFDCTYSIPYVPPAP